MKFLLLLILLLLMSPTQGAKVISSVTSIVESDITGLTGGTMASSAIIMQNGTMYDAYTDEGLLASSPDFNSLWDATVAEIGSGEIILRAGEYIQSKTIDIPQGIFLRGERGAVLTPSKNVDMVRMRPGGSISCIAFEPHRLAGWDSVAIIISSEDPWSDFYPAAYRYRISDVDMWGDTGTALLLDATGKPGYNPDNGIGGYICGVVATNTNILGFYRGLWLKCDTTHSFINGNKFSDFHFTGAKYSVLCDHIGGDASEGMDGNIFDNFHIQYMPGMMEALNLSGRYNRISAMIWDWGPDTAVTFQPGTCQNYALLGVDKSKIDDRGGSYPEVRNTIISYI